MSPSSIGLVVFGLYLVTVVVIGLVSARYQETSEDFWVASRRFGVVVLVIANIAAIMHGGSILSGMAFAGRFGGVAILPYLSMSLGFAVIFFFFAKKLFKYEGGIKNPIGIIFFTLKLFPKYFAVLVGE